MKKALTKKSKKATAIGIDLASVPDRSVNTVFINGKPASREFHEQFHKEISDHMRDYLMSGVSTKPVLKDPEALTKLLIPQLEL